MEQTQSTSAAMMPAKKKLPGVFVLLGEAKELVMKRKNFFFLIAAIPAGFSLLAQILLIYLPALALVAVILLIVSVVISLLAAIATVKGVADASMNDWKAAYTKSKSLFWPMIWAAILVAIVTMIGFILFVIPGIWLSISLSFYLMALVLENKRGWDSAKRSMDLVKGNWWGVFGRIFGFGILVAIVAIIFTGIAAVTRVEAISLIAGFIINVVVTPISIAFSYLLFKALKGQKASEMPKPSTSPQSSES